jgi:Protein of unknown function (DUF3485)
VRMLPILAALPLVLAYGIGEGLWAGRWHRAVGLDLAVTRLETVPLQIGDWHGEALELDARQVERAEIEGYLLRRYTHAGTGTEVTVLIVCGRPGPIAVHPPDVCYGGAGYVLKGAPTRATVDGEAPAGSAEFWEATFEKNDPAVPELLAIRWAWGANGEWTASDHPRLHFACAVALYKMYVICPVPLGEKANPDKPTREFLPPLLAELQKALFPKTLP